MSDYPRPETLSEEHFESVLAPRYVSREVAEERGYASVRVEHRRWLKAQGFTEGAIKNVIAHGGILIPSPTLGAQLDTYQLRPDRPRTVCGKKRKYESQNEVANALDIPPRSREHLENPRVPLVIAEGPIKADALLSAGMQCVVSIRGSWGWRTEWDEATIALPEFELMPWKGRDVQLVPDSDVTSNPNVRSGWVRLAALAQLRGAEAKLLYPPALPGSKFGVDDYLAAGGLLQGLAVFSTDALEEAPEKQLSPEMLREIAGDPIRMMDKLVAYYAKHLAAETHVHELMALWALHTHAIEAFNTTAYFALGSIEPESGKSRAMELLDLTCRNSLTTMNVSDAALYRAIEMMTPTLLVDELDGILSDKQERKQFVSMLNAGYRRQGGSVLRIGGANRDELEQFHPFCPKVFAGIGDVLPANLSSRCLHVELQPRLPDEAGGSFLWEDDAPEGHALRDRMDAWAQLNIEEMKGKRPKAPDGIKNRLWEGVRPLLIIAEQIGGDWSERLLKALQEVTGGREAHSWRVKLLSDCRTVFLDYISKTGKTEIEKAQMLQRLKDLPQTQWDEWGYDANRLSRELAKFRIKQDRLVGPEAKRRRGWFLEDFEDAWARYLSPLPNDEEGEKEDAQLPVQEEISVQSVQDEKEDRPDPFAVRTGRKKSAVRGENERPSPFLVRSKGPKLAAPGYVE